MTMNLIKVAYDCFNCAHRHHIITFKGVQIKIGDIEGMVCPNCGKYSKQLIQNIKPHSEFKTDNRERVVFT